MQVVIFPLPRGSTDADIVEDAGGKGRGKTERGERFQTPFQNLTVSLISGFSGRPIDSACRHDART